MKKYFLFFVCVLMTSATAFAQKNKKEAPKHDTVAYYMRNSQEMAYSQADARFLRLVIKSDSGLFNIEDYYMDAKPKLLARSFIDKMNFESGAHGNWLEYYPNGNKKNFKNYDNGQLVGDDEEYYPNGILYNVIKYKKDSVYLEKCQDTTGRVLANNGNGFWLKLNDDFPGTTLSGPVLNGKENGEWTRVINDSIRYSIVYKNGVVVSGQEFLNLIPEIFTAVEKSPSFPGGDGKFGNFLGKNIRYPATAFENNVQGRVIVTFIVERDGQLTHIKVDRGIGSGCDEEALRVISMSPNWVPGMQNGKPVRVNYSVPIQFSIDTSNDVPSKKKKA